MGIRFGGLLTPREIPSPPIHCRVNVLPLEDHHFNNTKADQFVGLYNEAGISKILIGRNPLRDHLQYRWSIPEASVAVLGGAVAALVLWRARFYGNARLVAPAGQLQGQGFKS